jgi:siderophore synthetase component
MLAESSSITLPLLGTGTQGLNARDVARELLSALPRWAGVPRLRAIRMFTLERSHIAALNRALDDRELSSESSMWFMVRRELTAAIEQGSASDPVRAALKDLQQIVSAPEPSLRSVALEGRRLAEAVLRHLSGDRDAAASERADRITPDLRLLIEHGRAAAAGGAVDEHDAVLIVRSAMRAAARTSA